MNQMKHHPALMGPTMMFISAALFGYFGFKMGLSHINSANQFVLFFALLDWTLKITAVGFALAGVITIIRPFPGNLIYGVVGLLSAILFVVIALMDYLDKKNSCAAPGFLLVIFAAWNGYGSITGLASLLQIMKMNSRPPMEPGMSPESPGEPPNHPPSAPPP